MSKPAVGRYAPEFNLPSHQGGNLSLANFKGKKLLIYFYPKDDTPGCTRQACALNNDLRALSGLSLSVVGVSRDGVQSHKKFAQKFNLRFPLLADEQGEMSEAYGVWVEKSMYGKKYFGIERSSFLIDESGKVIAIWRKVSPDEHLQWVRDQLKNQLTGITNSTKSDVKLAVNSAAGQQTPSGKVSTTMATTKKKPAAKKATAAKKPAAKRKPAAKKATAAKKPAAKKTTAKKATKKAATARKTAKKATTAKKPAAKRKTAKKKAA